jgi:hypothetical protein
MKPFITRGLRIGGAMVALFLCGLTAFYVKVILTDAVPVVARHRAEDAQHQREVDFLKATAGSAKMAMDSCVIESWPEFLYQAEEKALSEPDFNHTGWKPACKITTGYATAFNDPFVMCQYLSWLGRLKKKAPANSLDNGTGYYFVCGWECQGDVEVAGETCVSGDNSYRSFSNPVRWPSNTDYSGAHRNALNIANLRLKIEQCSDARPGPQHCVATIWVSRQRTSWGNYLVDELASTLRRQVFGLLLLLALAAATLISTVWRIIVISRKRDPNSPIPWIVEVPLRFAALDYEPDFYLNERLDRCDECLDRKLMKWPGLCVVVAQGLPPMLARRIIFLTQRPFSMAAERFGKVRKKATEKTDISTDDT